MNGGYESNLVATVFCYKTIIRKEEQYQMARRYHEIKGLAEYTARLHLGYKNCILLTKVAFGLQKLRIAYKYLVVELQSCISGYKTASRFAIELE